MELLSLTVKSLKPSLRGKKAKQRFHVSLKANQIHRVRTKYHRPTDKSRTQTVVGDDLREK